MQEKKLRDASQWLLDLHDGYSRDSVVDHYTGECVELDITDRHWQAAWKQLRDALASTTEETEGEAADSA